MLEEATYDEDVCQVAIAVVKQQDELQRRHCKPTCDSPNPVADNPHPSRELFPFLPVVDQAHAAKALLSLQSKHCCISKLVPVDAQVTRQRAGDAGEVSLEGCRRAVVDPVARW